MRVSQTEASGFLRMLSTQPLTACTTLPPSISPPSRISSNSVETVRVASVWTSRAASISSATSGPAGSAAPAPGAPGAPAAAGAPPAQRQLVVVDEHERAFLLDREHVPTGT